MLNWSCCYWCCGVLKWRSCSRVKSNGGYMRLSFSCSVSKAFWEWKRVRSIIRTVCKWRRKVGQCPTINRARRRIQKHNIRYPEYCILYNTNGLGLNWNDRNGKLTGPNCRWVAIVCLNKRFCFDFHFFKQQSITSFCWMFLCLFIHSFAEVRYSAVQTSFSRLTIQ